MLVVLALTALVWLAYGRGAIGYDAAWSLVWGQQLADGAIPEFKGTIAPTPHPLSNVVAAVLTPLDDAAVVALDALHVLAFGVLGWAGYRFGRALFTPAVGVLFAALLLTRPLMLNAAGQNLVDLPFLTFTVWAAALAAEAPRRGLPVLALLALAGGLRPEAWPLAAAYAAFLLLGRPRPRVLPIVLVAVAAPMAWGLFDLVATGDPLWSLHGTQSLAAELERPRGLPRAVETLPFLLEDILTPTVIWASLGGLVLGLYVLPERAALPATLAALGFAGFLILGIAGLPLLYRYLGLPAAMLAVFAPVAVAGWRIVAPGPTRNAWMAIGAVLGVVLAVGVPRTADQLGNVDGFLESRLAIQRDLDRLADAPVVRRELARCPRLYVPDHKPTPLLSVWLHRRPDTIRMLPAGSAEAVFVLYATRVAAVEYSLAAPAPPPSDLIGSGRLRVIYENPSWRVYSGCRPD